MQKELVSMNPTYKGSIESLRNFWETRSRSFEKDYSIRTEGIIKIAQEITGLIRGKTVLEIGCGPGILANLYPKGTDIIGLDFSTSMLRRAKSRIGQLVLGDSLSLPFDRGAFEVVTCFFVASDYSEKEDIFSEAHRALKDRGLFLFADYSSRDGHWVLRKRIRPVLGESCSIYIEDQETLLKELKAAGLKVQVAKLIQFSASFELRRYLKSEAELQRLKEVQPSLFKNIQHLMERKIVRREFVLLVSSKQR
jgi:ubiquinone/menaquinone biosynthesis C-methylase UbiE